MILMCLLVNKVQTFKYAQFGVLIPSRRTFLFHKSCKLLHFAQYEFLVACINNPSLKNMDESCSSVEGILFVHPFN